MRPELLSVICDPSTHDPLRLERGAKSKGDFLLNPATGETYPIIDGIPCLLLPEDLTGENKRYQGLYDRIARGYDLAEKVVADLTWGGQDAVRRELLAQVLVPPSSLVLEVSIGTGINLRYLPADARYVGLDISFGMLRQCARNLSRWRRQGDLIQGSAKHLPFREATFDVVFHLGGINFFNDRALALQEMIRVAKPSTKLVVGDETELQAKRRDSSRLPFAHPLYRLRSRPIAPPAELLPLGIADVRTDEVWKGKFYIMTFTKPR